MDNQFTVVGSEEMLKPLILQMLRDYYSKSQEVGIGGGHSKLPTDTKGKILITFVFEGQIDNSSKMHIVEKSFRLMKDDPRTILPARTAEIGNLIKTKFDNFTFRTGTKTYTYNNPDQGFNRIWGYFEKREDAKRLYEQMLDVQGFSPDWKRLSTSIIEEPGDRFAVLPGKIQQGGIMIRPEQERPLATMRFQQALLKFPHIRKWAGLVDEYGSVIDLTKFLAQYQN